MAFAIRNLSVLAYANGFTLWHYKSGKDSLDAISGQITWPTPRICCQSAT